MEYSDPVLVLVSVCSALGGALSTYVLARIERSETNAAIAELRAQRERDERVRSRDRKQLLFAMSFIADIANKNNMGERFSTGILRVLSFTPTEPTHDNPESA